MHKQCKIGREFHLQAQAHLLMEHVVISNWLQLLAHYSGSVSASMGGSAGTTTAAGPLLGKAEEEAGFKVS